MLQSGATRVILQATKTVAQNRWASAVATPPTKHVTKAVSVPQWQSETQQTATTVQKLCRNCADLCGCITTDYNLNYDRLCVCRRSTSWAA